MADMGRSRRKGEQLPASEPSDRAADEMTQLARIPEENPDPVFRISAGHVLLYRNPAGKKLCRVWGCRLGQKVPAPIQALVSAALADGAVAQHEMAFASRIYWLTVAPSAADGYVNIYARDITDHKWTERALRQTEQEFRAIFDNTSDGIFLLDLETRRFTMGNQSCLQMLGYTEEEFTRLCMEDLHDEADLPFIYAQIEEFLTGGKPIRHDIRFKRKDGSILFVDVSPSQIELHGRRYALVALKDITERKRMEEELRQHAEHLAELVEARTGELQESEKRYRSLYHTIADGIFVVGIDGQIVDVNDSACGQLGYTREELIGMPLSTISARPDFHLEEILDRLRAGGSLSYETTHRRKDGVLIPIELSVASVEYRSQPAVLGVARDITERRHTQESLQFTQFAIDHTADAAFWMTEEGRFFYVNEAACRALGYSRAELLEMTVFEIDPAFTESLWRESWRKLKAEKSILLETVHRAKDGRIYPVEIRANYLEFGGRAYDCAFARDITERKRAEETLREKDYLLSESQRIGHIGSWSVDLATGTATWSSETYRLYGVSPDTFTPSADALLGRLHPDDRAALQEWIRAALAGEHPEAMEMRAILPDGSIRVLSGRGELVFADDHRPVRLVGTVQDVTEQKQAQAALLESEERYRILLEHGFDGIFVHEDFRIVQLNDRLAEMAGRTRSELLGRQFIDVFSPESQEHIRQYAGSGLGGYIELELQRPDGQIVKVESYGASCRFQGREARIVGFRDITERHRSQEALRESEAGLAAAQRLAHLGSWWWDIATDTAHWSQETFRIFGIPPGPLQQHREGFISRIVPEDRQRVDQALSDALSGAGDYDLDYRIRLPDGREKVIHAQAQVSRSADGQPVMMHGTVQDITERKQAEEALRESEERFRTAFEEGAVPMALTALDSTLLKVNASFCRMLGFRESELVGKSFNEITHPDDRAANAVGTRQLASGEISSFHMEKRYVRKDGGVIWGDLSTVSVRDAEGQPLYCITHVQDITERKRAEEALRRLNERLELQVAQRTEELRHTVDRLRQLTLELSQAEDRERRRIAAILHEDVQQMLAAARFHLNLLDSEPRSAEESQEIVGQVKHMLKDAIEKSRNLSHELSPALYQVGLLEILSWLARHMEQKHGLTVRVEARGPVDSPSEPLKAFLYKVAQELLFNVVKHAGVRQARIRVRRRGSYLYLSVADRGRGFDPQRLERTAGFGLLGIRERVQSLGGRMKITSAPGAGSRFLIAIPYETASRIGGPGDSSAGPAASEVPA